MYVYKGFKQALNIYLIILISLRYITIEYTPGHIPFAEDSDLCAITGAPGGRIVALKVFCHKWQIQYEEKIRSGSYTIYHPE